MISFKQFMNEASNLNANDIRTVIMHSIDPSMEDKEESRQIQLSIYDINKIRKILKQPLIKNLPNFEEISNFVLANYKKYTIGTLSSTILSMSKEESK